MSKQLTLFGKPVSKTFEQKFCIYERGPQNNYEWFIELYYRRNVKGSGLTKEKLVQKAQKEWREKYRKSSEKLGDFLKPVNQTEKTLQKSEDNEEKRGDEELKGLHKFFSRGKKGVHSSSVNETPAPLSRSTSKQDESLERQELGKPPYQQVRKQSSVINI